MTKRCAAVVPPQGWTPRKQGYCPSDIDLQIPHPIRQIATGSRGLYRLLLVSGKPQSVAQVQPQPASVLPDRQPRQSSQAHLSRYAHSSGSCSVQLGWLVYWAMLPLQSAVRVVHTAPPKPDSSQRMDCSGVAGSAAADSASTQDYAPMAIQAGNLPPATESPQDLERRFWRSLGLKPPLYGADVEGSLFDEDLEVRCHACSAYLRTGRSDAMHVLHTSGMSRQPGMGAAAGGVHTSVAPAAALPQRSYAAWIWPWGDGPGCMAGLEP